MESNSCDAQTHDTDLGVTATFSWLTAQRRRRCRADSGHSCVPRDCNWCCTRRTRRQRNTRELGVKPLDDPRQRQAHDGVLMLFHSIGHEIPVQMTVIRSWCWEECAHDVRNLAGQWNFADVFSVHETRSASGHFL